MARVVAFRLELTTQWLNIHGGIEADVTVIRLSETRFMVVSIASSQTRDLAWLRRHIPDDAHCHVFDATSGISMLTVMGPNSRTLLERVSGEALDDARFRFGSSREIEVGLATVRASRLTYVGEPGWELYVPSEMAAHTYDRLMQAGGDLGVDDGGFLAVNSMRMEKGYRHWGHDIGNRDTPFEAGLGFAVAMDKPDGFNGRDALARQLDRGPLTRRLVQFRLAQDCGRLLHHDEPILLDGRIVGGITSGAYGHRTGLVLGMGYVAHPDGVTAALLRQGRFEIEIACERYPATAQFGAWFDPSGLRIRA